jgi:segregation and condensation protein B
MTREGSKQTPDTERSAHEARSLDDNESPFAALQTGPNDHGLSLEDLSSAYAALLGQGYDPYQPIEAPPPADEHQRSFQEDQTLLDQWAEENAADDAPERCTISPRTLVEAMLFVGHPHNEPMSAGQLASLMRGVRAEEVEEIIRDLCQTYREEGAPYTIVAEGAGFRMTLLEEFRPLRDKFYGRVREVRLSQAAIDLLALVAYNQPISRADLDALRDKDNGAILSQLVRRRLLRVERREETPQVKYYRTTDRFLKLFGLASVEDLPRTQDLDR